MNNNNNNNNNSTENNSTKSNFLKNSFFVGGMAGIVSRTLTAPLELMKIQQQNSFIQNTTLYDVVKKEGIYRLWKGNLTNCIRIFPQSAINLYVYKSTSKKIDFSSKYLDKFICGGIAGMVSITSVYPLENARTRLALQTNNNKYKGIVDVLRKTNVRDIYRGCLTSNLGFAPYNALNFLFFNILNDNINNKLISGGLAGTFAVTITYPSDLIRRRLQIQGLDKSVPKYNGIKDCIYKIIKTDGYKGLYRGLIPCYIKIFPATAIQFYIFSLIIN